jgi:PIN domain nuclease of toxin-antitoxin system
VRLLLDTHALIWSLGPRDFLSRAAQAAIADSKSHVYASAVSANLVANYLDMLEAIGFRRLDLSTLHALKAGSLPFPHRDPFDRFLIAQAMDENLTLVSNAKLFDSFGVQRLW